MPDLTGLHEHEEALAIALLPADPDPTAELDARSRFLTHAYLALGHAVVEEFIEDCFSRFVEKALGAATSTVPGCFVSLATRFAEDVVGQTHTHPPADQACPMLRGLYSSKVIRPNNGISRRNLIALAKPLGLQGRLESDCEDLLTVSDTLGARRGRVAHLGAVVLELRPREARMLVADVVDQLPLLLTLLDLT